MRKDWLPPEERLARIHLRNRLAEAQGHRCAYCGVRFGAEFRHWKAEMTQATLDRIVPGSDGGGYTWDNLVAACLRCNGARKSEDAFLFFERKGWMTGKDRRLGDWLEKAIRKAQPLPWWIVQGRARAAARRRGQERRARREAKGAAALNREAAAQV